MDPTSLLTKYYQQQLNFKLFMDQHDDTISNREQKKHQMALASHKKNKQSGTFENINQIFHRLPLPRLEKSNYKFLFQSLKENVENHLAKQNKLFQIQNEEADRVKSIQIKMGKFPKLPPEQQLHSEKLQSGAPLFQALIYLKNQNNLFLQKYQGNTEPFLSKFQNIEFDKISYQIPTIKILAQQDEPLRKHRLSFINQNTLIFSQKSFPSTYEIQKRAEILAKLYLLKLYRQQSRKMLIMDRNQEVDLEKKRQINKIKHEMEVEKMRQGELVQDMDLLKQVYKIRDLIERKMNSLAYEEFKIKNGSRATQIKRSLEKLKQAVDAQSLPKLKLKMLIAYKYKKGW